MFTLLRGQLNTQGRLVVGRMSGATAASGNGQESAEVNEGDKSPTKNNTDTVTDKDKKKRDQLAELKQKYESMSVDERRNVYSCGQNFLGLDDIPHWQKTYEAHKYYYEDIAKSVSDVFDVDASLNSKVSLCQGDITKLEIDAIVNAANESLMGGGGVDGAIHRAAGADELHLECYFLNGCATGDAKMTLGYKLPAKFVIHTVGPIGEKPELLASCYKTSLDLAVANNLRTIAFPCISTGIYGYPNKNAAMVVLKTVREWLQANGDRIDRIIFILFLMKDVKIYYSLMPVFFPFPPTEEQKPAEEK